MDISIRERGSYRFGPFRLDPVRRALTRNGIRIKLAARLFDLLFYLVQNHDRLVERDELLQAVWHGRTVVEGNLGQAISTLRKTLQAAGETESVIVTAPGRGYRLGVAVELESLESAVPDLNEAAEPQAVPARTGWRWAVGATAIVAGGAALWQLTGTGPADRTIFSPPPRSVAVMPFTNMSSEPAQEYFSDGLAEELTNSLSQVGALQVAARLSAFSFKGRAVTVGEIGRQLNVRAVLEGSVRRQGSRLRITAQLVDATTGYQLCSHSFDRDQADLLGVQAEIAAAVVANLKVTLLGDEAEKLKLGQTRDARAFDAYLRGVALSRSGGAQTAEAALAAFEKAIALDPGYALARTYRAQALRDVAYYSDNPDPAWAAGMEEEALAESERAIAIAPDLGVAHMVLGATLEESRFDFRRAGAELRRARELAPNDARVNGVYAGLQAHLGHMSEAVAASRQAAAADPLTPRTQRDLATILIAARRYDEAKVALQHAQQLEPTPAMDDLDLLGEIEWMQGHAENAARICAGGRTWQQQLCLAVAYHDLGHQPDAEAAMSKLRAALGDSGAVQYVQVYALWGRRDAALDWLETAYSLHDPGLIELKELPALDTIRSDPRFQTVQRRLDFPD